MDKRQSNLIHKNLLIFLICQECKRKHKKTLDKNSKSNLKILVYGETTTLLLMVLPKIINLLLILGIKAVKSLKKIQRLK